MATEKRQSGKLVTEGGRFFLEARGLRQEIPTGVFADEEALKGVVGEEVDLLFSEPVRFVVAIVPRVPKRPRIICYVPPPDWFNKAFVLTDPRLRVQLADRFLAGGVINQEVHEQLVAKAG